MASFDSGWQDPEVTLQVELSLQMSGSPWDGGLFTFGFQGNHLSWGDHVLKARVRVGSPSLSIVELIGDGAPKGKCYIRHLWWKLQSS